MPTYAMGSAIREMRIRLGYTQEELAYGVCSAGTLSKIENGQAVISKRVFEALCSKLPGMHHVWISCDTKLEMKRSKLCKQILFSLGAAELTKASEAMAQYHLLKEEGNPFCMQFELYTQAIYQGLAKKSEEEILPKLKKALKMTMPATPGYKTRFLAKKKVVLLTYDELYILSNMGIAYAKKNRTELAYRIFVFLKLYMEQQDLDLAESAKACPMLYGNLAWVLERQGQFDEAVKQCDTGINICIFAGNYTVLPHLFCIKARCYTASKNYVIARKCMQQAKAILDIKGNYRNYGSFEEFYKAREPIYVIY